NILRGMRWTILVNAALAAAIAACRSRPSADRAPRADSSAQASFPLHRDTLDSALREPRLVEHPAVVVFWLKAADTLTADDRASAYDDLRSYTAAVAPVLAANDITLLATRAETLYVALPHQQRRPVLLSGLDYPFGYVLVDPGSPERILTGVYSDDDLLDELR